jgi:hypothetical protein
MLRAVKLNHKASFSAVKVSNIVHDNHLPIKSISMIAEIVIPKLILVPSGISPQFLCEGLQFPVLSIHDLSPTAVYLELEEKAIKNCRCQITRLCGGTLFV